MARSRERPAGQEGRPAAAVFISSPGHFQLGEAESFQERLFGVADFTHVKDHLVIFPGGQKKKESSLWAGVKDLIACRVSCLVTASFQPWDPILLNASSVTFQRKRIVSSWPSWPSTANHSPRA